MLVLVLILFVLRFWLKRVKVLEVSQLEIRFTDGNIKVPEFIVSWASGVKV